MATITSETMSKAEEWVKHYSGTYKRDKHDVILDEPYTIGMFVHNELLYLKDCDQFLFHPETCDAIRGKDDMPQIWDERKTQIVDCEPDDVQ